MARGTFRHGPASDAEIAVGDAVPDGTSHPGAATGTMTNTVTVHRLDGAKITTSAEAMEAIAETLDLPDHFGHNLDALYDVLTDLSWLPPGEHLLVWTEPSALRAADRPAYEAVRTVLSDAVTDDAPGESFLSVLILTD